MKIDMGFFDKDGNYKEDIQEVEMLSVKELNEIELIKAQNNGLKAQNDSLQETLNKLKVKLNELKVLDKYRQKELETKAEATKSNIHNLALLSKANKTLQEIKKYIAKICKEECGYVQKKRCPDCDCRFGAILDLITKAEEE